MLQAGRFNILLDGQFGSTGKGLFAAYISRHEPVEIYASSLSPNAGHTFLYQNRQVVSKQIPVGGILHPRSTIYLTAESIIDPVKLAEECYQFDIDKDRLFIHPRAAIIDSHDIEAERDENSSVTKIASTQSGVGMALSRKIQRSSELAQNNMSLTEIATIRSLDLMRFLDEGCTIFMETSQGFDLSLNSGLSYPHCTSREITVQAALSAAQVHPDYLGDVSVCLRAYPIRVGHIYDDIGQQIGDSGPFYSDSRELGWDELDVSPEKTTVTKRNRRIATFSLQQYERMLHHLRPDYVFLNFANYIRFEDLETYNHMLRIRVPEFVGVGPGDSEIYPISGHAEAMHLFKTAAGEKLRSQASLTPRGIHTTAQKPETD